MRIGPLWRAQKRKTQYIAFGVVSIFAVIQKTEPMCGIRNVGPTLRRHFKLRLLCGRIASSGTLDGAEGNLESRFVAMRADRKSHFKQNMFFVPLRLHLHVDPRRARIQDDVAYKS